MKKTLRPSNSTVYALIVMLLISGVLVLVRGFNNEWASEQQLFDERLVEVAGSVDKNLENSQIFYAMMLSSFTKEETTKNAEKEWEESGSIKGLLKNMRSAALNSYPTVAGLVLLKDKTIVACTVCGGNCEYRFFDETENDHLIMCQDVDGRTYMAVLSDNYNGTMHYAVLLNLNQVYRSVINEDIMDNTAMVLYDDMNHIFVQNLGETSYVSTMSREAAFSKGGFYREIVTLDEAGQKGISEYSVTAGNNGLNNETRSYRLHVIPGRISANGYFTIGISFEYTRYQKETNIAHAMTYLALILILTAFCLAMYLISAYFSRVNELKNDIRILKYQQESAELNEKLLLTQMKNTASQMQPHFLYNALGSIREIVLDDPEYASDLIYDFTKHLRACIRYMQNDSLIPFSQEMENVQAYVNIEKMRFGEKLQVEYDVKIEDFMIAPLSIQPFVENAIRHGIFKRGRAGGTVTVSTGVYEDGFTVTIEDTGIGFNVNQVLNEVSTGKRDSTGIMNNIFRLEKLCHARVKIDSTEGVGTLVTVHIPVKETL